MPAEYRRPALSRTRRALLFCAGLLLAPALPAAEEQIFEPGSKHVCVPAASGEGWDCRSAEDGAAAPAAANKESREPKLRSSRDVPDEAQTAAAASEPAAVAPIAESPPNTTAPAAAPASTPPAAAESSRRLPNYLLSPEAQSTPPPRAAASAPARASAAPDTPAKTTAAATPPPAAPAPPAATPAPPRPAAPEPVAATPPPPTSVAASGNTPAAATSTGTTTTATPEPASPAAEPPAATAAAAAPEPPPARSAPLATLRGSSEFRRLGDGRFVLELASGADRGHVEDTAAGLALGRGEIYLLPLQRDGAPWFVAVWGDFDSVDAARAARDEAAAAGATPGFPRRVGPLKQELR